MEKVRVEPPYIKTKNVQSAAIQLIKNYLGWSIEIIKKELRDIHTTLDKTGAYVSLLKSHVVPEPIIGSKVKYRLAFYSESILSFYCDCTHLCNA
jgi:hypothetical protein